MRYCLYNIEGQVGGVHVHTRCSCGRIFMYEGPLDSYRVPLSNGTLHIIFHALVAPVYSIQYYYKANISTYCSVLDSEGCVYILYRVVALEYTSILQVE